MATQDWEGALARLDGKEMSIFHKKKRKKKKRVNLIVEKKLNFIEIFLFLLIQNNSNTSTYIKDFIIFQPSFTQIIKNHIYIELTF